MSYQPIENYGIIGNLETVALVGLDGSIDFLSFPEFDSPTIFAAMLDSEKGGRFRITPHLGHAKRTQMYLPDTNVLMTRFLASTGVAEIIDFMPISADEHRSAIVRRVRTVRGVVRFQAECAPRFDYGRSKHTAHRRKDAVLFRSTGEDKTVVRLRSTQELSLRDGDVIADFELHAGEHVDFYLENAAAEQEVGKHLGDWCKLAFDETVKFWHSWSQHSNYTGRWRETVQRSALTLKLLTSRKHGSLVAAATFGLPEGIGGERNWDYRFAWIRDSSFTLYALLRLGYTEEARGFMGWIEARCNELGPDGSLQIMYGIDGRHELPEQELDHLEGYEKSKPIRIGNAAYDQLQLDIYGELMDSVYLYDKYGSPISIDLWRNLVRLIDWVCKNWRREDEGIWEVRGGQREFLYSRLLCWVAVDRGLRLAESAFPARRRLRGGARCATRSTRKS